MNDNARILLVDDEASIRLTLSALLQRSGYQVTAAENGEQALQLLEQHEFDLLLTDLKMPGVDGMHVVAGARQRQPEIAVIVLTGHGSLESAIEGMHLRIFDYVLKTSTPEQVLARVEAALCERTQQQRQHQLLAVVGSALAELRGEPAPPEGTPTTAGRERMVTVGMFQLDTWRQQAIMAERKLPLTPTEFRVLLCLAEHAGALRSYPQLVRCAQGYDAGELEASELIKPHIHHLRQKLEEDSSAPRYILNVRGKGYMLSPFGNGE
ncbi:MAG TPA: response regulator transcription factor [Roseiflexaceae bacterium]|nr:response regulator transcription factor [Roseiflexaceae bacterium]